MFVRYVSARVRSHAEERAYHNYIADGIKILTGNTANEDKYILTMRLAEILNGKVPEPEKTVKEIIAEIKANVEGGE